MGNSWGESGQGGRGWYKPVSVAPAIPSYIYRGVFPTTAGADTTVVTFAMDIGTSPAVVAVFISEITAAVITSVVVDPSGSNVSLTKNTQQDSSTSAGVTTAWWSGFVSSPGGTINIQVTYATSVEFFQSSYFVYTLTGLASNSARTATSTFPSLNIGVTAGCILLAGAANAGGVPIPWAGTTETPFGTYDDSVPYASVEDWTIISTNASFISSNIFSAVSAVTFF